MDDMPKVGDQILIRYTSSDDVQDVGPGWIGRLTVEDVRGPTLVGHLDKVRQSSGFVEGMFGGFYLGDDNIKWAPWVPIIEEDPL